MNSYRKHFSLRTHEVTDKACQYLHGLMRIGSRKNMDRIAEVVPKAKSRNLQQFLTHSTWDARKVIDHVARDVNTLLGDKNAAALIIQESGFVKRGGMSVGAARQRMGRLGKVENGQLALFGVLAQDRFVAPVDVRLYLPEEWAHHEKRCERAAIPKEDRRYQTETTLALQIVDHARENNLSFAWISADRALSEDPAFCIALAYRSETFMVEVHSALTDYKGMRIADRVMSIPNREWIPIKIRDIEGKDTTILVIKEPAHIVDPNNGQIFQWNVIGTKKLGPNPDPLFLITNMPETTPLEWMVGMQLQRLRFEAMFEAAKRSAGLGDYQVRKWGAWHHHMALVLMAIRFMLSEWMKYDDSTRSFSSDEIEKIVTHFLSGYNNTQKVKTLPARKLPQKKTSA